MAEGIGLYGPVWFWLSTMPTRSVEGLTKNVVPYVPDHQKSPVRSNVEVASPSTTTVELSPLPPGVQGHLFPSARNPHLRL